MMDDLQIVIFRSDPVRSRSLTFGGIIELLSTAIPEIGVPIPLVPTNVLTKDFHILTYPPAVSRVAVVAKQLGLWFDYVHGATQTKILEYKISEEYWLSVANILPDNLLGHWLLWGVNWLILDSHQALRRQTLFGRAIQDNPRWKQLYEDAEREDTYRSLISIHNPITTYQVDGNTGTNNGLEPETKPNNHKHKY